MSFQPCRKYIFNLVLDYYRLHLIFLVTILLYVTFVFEPILKVLALGGITPPYVS